MEVKWSEPSLKCMLNLQRRKSQQRKQKEKI